MIRAAGGDGDGDISNDNGDRGDDGGLSHSSSRYWTTKALEALGYPVHDRPTVARAAYLVSRQLS